MERERSIESNLEARLDKLEKTGFDKEASWQKLQSRFKAKKSRPKFILLRWTAVAAAACISIFFLINGNKQGPTDTITTKTSTPLKTGTTNQTIVIHKPGSIAPGQSQATAPKQKRVPPIIVEKAMPEKDEPLLVENIVPDKPLENVVPAKTETPGTTVKASKNKLPIIHNNELVTDQGYIPVKQEPISKKGSIVLRSILKPIYDDAELIIEDHSTQELKTKKTLLPISSRSQKD